jgi:hypothetical protein
MLAIIEDVEQIRKRVKELRKERQLPTENHQDDDYCPEDDDILIVGYAADFV